jgi:hypothetical protein
VDDVTCTEIILAAGFHHGEVLIGRSLTMTGDSSETTGVVGTVTVQGATTEVTFNDFHIEVPEPGLPFNGLVVVGNAKALTSGESLFVGITDFLFVDGFESGDTSAWSGTGWVSPITPLTKSVRRGVSAAGRRHGCRSS